MKRTERLLLLSGLVCLAYCATVAVRSAKASKAGEKIHVISRAQATAAQSVTGQESVSEPVFLRATDKSSPGYSDVIGRLEIRQLNLSVPILFDDGTESLLKGVGHIPGTAMPGGLGTVGLAGHRDIYLRPLRRVARGMDIRLVDKTGTYHYQVDSTEIVTPDQVRVLDVQSRPELALVTCYPFYFVGNAPKRFIVHAHLLSALPDVQQ